MNDMKRAKRIFRLIAAFLIIGAVAGTIYLLLSKEDMNNPALALNNTSKLSKIEIISITPRGVVGSYDIQDLALLNNNEFWAVGYDGEHTQRLYYSKNSGKTWDHVDTPGNGFTLKAISFSDSQHGWAVGGNGTIIRTTNGGKSWELVKSPTEANLQAVHFFNSQIGYIAGNKGLLNPINDEVTGNVEILCTNDGGITWHRCYSRNQHLSVFQILALSEAEAYVVLGGNQLIRTLDKGQTWEEVSSQAKSIHSIALSSDGTKWLAGYGGIFLQSRGTDWGQAISVIENSPTNKWEAIAFINKGNGLAVGENGILVFTSNNGKSWESPKFDISDNLRAIRLKDSVGVILGSKNLYYISFLP